MVASEIPSSISSCVRSFLRSTISVCTTEIRAINPPNAVLPILRKLKNRDHREGPFIKGAPSFFGIRLIIPGGEFPVPHGAVRVFGALPRALPLRFITAPRTVIGLGDVRNPLLHRPTLVSLSLLK